jgi:hypothetical protein
MQYQYTIIINGVLYMKHLMCFVLFITIFLSSIELYSEPTRNGESCFSSYNSKGKYFYLHIYFDGRNVPKTIRYKQNSTAIPLSYYGREDKYISMIGEYRSARVFLEVYKNQVTGKLYILDRPLVDGLFILFERTKDNQLFNFYECN